MKEKRQKIIEESIGLFSEQGYEGTTMKQIAGAAGVSFGSIFTYFENKEELFHCAVVEPLEDYSKQILNFNPEAQDTLDELKRMVTNQISLFARFGTYLNLVVQVISHHHRFEKTFEELDAFHDSFRAKLVKLIETGQRKELLYHQDPLFIATSYTSLLMGLRVNLTEEPDSDVWEKFAPFAMQLFGPKPN
ncbi:TetR/AcrR family transcriptional regulator [Bacillus marinisedimentorum]|uniref:TetR/AcrR family transcriptional regulator n=1 Tax=Bacillus marinisedimentorum TaxID=1821260 RepID=UPI001FE176A2|nr:TetR/AcrR family transcriptional regulator [Bacillus marinisedimentorum]